MVVSGVPLEYIYDMTPKELFYTLKQLDLKSRNREEKHRFLCYIIAQGNSTKSILPKDIYPLVWDETETDAIDYSQQEVEELRVLAKKMEDDLNYGRE